MFLKGRTYKESARLKIKYVLSRTGWWHCTGYTRAQGLALSLLLSFFERVFFCETTKRWNMHLNGLVVHMQMLLLLPTPANSCVHFFIKTRQKTKSSIKSLFVDEVDCTKSGFFPVILPKTQWQNLAQRFSTEFNCDSANSFSHFCHNEQTKSLKQKEW